MCDKAYLVSCFGIEYLDFEQSSYNQLPCRKLRFLTNQSQVKSCDIRVPTPGMSPP